MKASQKILMLLAGVPFVFFSCGGGDDDDETFAEENYKSDQRKVLADVFGDEFKSASATYVVGDGDSVATNKPEENKLPWTDFEITLSSKEKEGSDSFVSYTATLPSPIASNDAYNAVFPKSGLFKLGDVTSDTIKVERYTSVDKKDDKFFDGSIKVSEKGIVLKFEIKGVTASPTARVDGTPNATWEFTLSKKGS